MFKRFVLLTFLAFTAAQSAPDPTVDEIAEQFQAAVTKAAKEKKAEKGESRYEMTAYTGQLTETLRHAKLRGDLNNLQQVVSQIQGMLGNAEVTRLGDALVAKVTEETMTREQAYVNSVDSDIEKAVKLCFAAKTPKELDESIIALSKTALRENYNSNFELSRRSAERARAAVTFLCRWQDYLLQTESGNTAAAAGVLRSLSQDTSAYPFVPRSEILDRMKQLNAGGSSDENAPVKIPSLQDKSLADLTKLRSEVRELTYRNPNSQPVRQLSEQLAALNRAKEQFNSGLVGTAFAYCTNHSGNNSDEDLSALRQQLLIQLLPVYLDVAKTYPTQPNETALDYLQRTIKEARAKADWVTAWKALDAYKSVAFGGNAPSWLTSDIQGVSLFIVAQNLEKAGQYVDAIRGYKRVVGQAGQNLPIEEATARLVALEKEQPKAYEDANKPAEPVVRQYPSAPNPNR